MPYKVAVKRAMAEVEIKDPPVIPLPLPRDLLWPDRIAGRRDAAYSRLSVAYGLSFLKATLDEHRFPHEIRPYPFKRSTSHYVQRHAPTSEDV
jgi:hypothetical protein